MNDEHYPTEIDAENGERVKCPRCGSESFKGCRYEGDFGGALKFMDRYSAACSKCGFVVSVNISGGDVGQSEWVTQCPFCGMPYNGHNRQ